MLEGVEVGEQLSRREVHARFGGRQQGGIGPSRVAPVVLFFTDPISGHRHGYYDGWDEEGYYNYVGEGQHGNQQLNQGNRAILRHATDGRSLEGFLASGTEVTYLGDFKLVDYHFTEAHESGDPETLRQVVVFRLRPLQHVPVALPYVPVTARPEARLEVVAVEETNTERAFVTPDRALYDVERREAALVQSYCQHLRRQGHRVGRLRITPPAEAAPLFSDLWDETVQELVEAKGGVTRELLRMAVGQLLDYGRFAGPHRPVVLVPERPRPDLVDYLTQAGLTLVYPAGGAFERVPPVPRAVSHTRSVDETQPTDTMDPEELSFADEG